MDKIYDTAYERQVAYTLRLKVKYGIVRKQYFVPEEDHEKMSRKADLLKAKRIEEVDNGTLVINPNKNPPENKSHREQQLSKTTKRCTYCEETKPFSFFRKSKSTKDGYADTCKPCKHRITNKPLLRH